MASTERLRKRARLSSADEDLYMNALSGLSVDEWKHLDLVMVARSLRRPVHHVDSYFRKIVERRRKKQLGIVPERLLGLNKQWDMEFAASVGVRAPQTIWRGPLSEHPPELHSGRFLKPLKSSDSKGAFYLNSDGSYFSVGASVSTDSWSEVHSMCQKQMGVEDLDSVTWEVQEMVEEAPGVPGRDFKFYMFYGKIGLVVEVVRFPHKQYKYFLGNGKVARCGRQMPKFADPQQTIFDKGGVSEAKLEAVREMSSQIPVPFMRIDFLNGAKELVFCEFSSAPGNSDQYNAKFDRYLGELYNSAEIRLVNDLLRGKQFDAFHRWSGKVQASLIKNKPQ